MMLCVYALHVTVCQLPHELKENYFQFTFTTIVVILKVRKNESSTATVDHNTGFVTFDKWIKALGRVEHME